jgi:hypothetical protein
VSIELSRAGKSNLASEVGVRSATVRQDRVDTNQEGEEGARRGAYGPPDGRLVVHPEPSCPCRLFPHVHTSPRAVVATEWAPPAPIEYTYVPRGGAEEAEAEEDEE